MRVLVLGSTGLIGNAIVRALIEHDHKVTSTCRDTKVPLNLDLLNVTIVHGDMDGPGQIDAWMQGMDVVIDAATPYPMHLMYTANTHAKPTLDYARRRTDMILSAMAKHGTKLVHLSTLLAQPNRPGRTLSGMQQRLMRILHPYFAMKSMLEKQLVQAAPRVPGIMIIQPSACLGPYDIKPNGQSLIPNIINNRPAISISHKINLIDTRDVADGIVAAIEAQRFGETIRLTGHNTTTVETLKNIEKFGGCEEDTARINVPAALGVLPTYWMELAWGAIGRPSPMPSLLPVLICEQEWLAPGKAQQSLGLVNRPLETTLRDTVNWYQSLGYC